MKKNIILFLDIDGVVTSCRTGWYNLDIYNVNYLRWVCKETGAKIVISSTWRSNHGIEFWKAIFGEENIHEDFKTKHIKPESDRSTPRGEEIDEWLSRHTDVIRYLILDDDSDMLEHQKENFIQTDSMDGMLTEHFIKVKDFFEIKGFPHFEMDELYQHPLMFGVNNLKQHYHE